MRLQFFFSFVKMEFRFDWLFSDLFSHAGKENLEPNCYFDVLEEYFETKLTQKPKRVQTVNQP